MAGAWKAKRAVPSARARQRGAIAPLARHATLIGPTARCACSAGPRRRPRGSRGAWAAPAAARAPARRPPARAWRNRSGRVGRPARSPWPARWRCGSCPFLNKRARCRIGHVRRTHLDPDQNTRISFPRKPPGPTARSRRPVARRWARRAAAAIGPRSDENRGDATTAAPRPQRRGQSVGASGALPRVGRRRRRARAAPGHRGRAPDRVVGRSGAGRACRRLAHAARPVARDAAGTGRGRRSDARALRRCRRLPFRAR